MATITRLKLKGFRRFLHLDLPFKSFMVFIGANGSGKTAFLEALALLSASTTGNLNKAIADLGGFASLITRDVADSLSVTVEMAVPEYPPLVYELELTAKGNSYAISKETLSQVRPGFATPFYHINSSYDDIRYFNTDAHRLIRPSWAHNPWETSLSQVPKMFQQPEEFRQLLAAATHYHLLDVGPLAPIKKPQPMKPVPVPSPTADDLIPFLYDLRETHLDVFEAILDTRRAGFPDLETLAFPPVAAGLLTMTWKDKKFRTSFYLHELSEGTLRFLWLAALLHSPHLTTLTLIDEPEVSLHSELLSLLAEVMREAAQQTKVIVATHSDCFIRFLTPAEVVVLDVDERGFTTATWADTMDLNHGLAAYTLDQVWQLGRMGGARENCYYHGRRDRKSLFASSPELSSHHFGQQKIMVSSFWLPHHLAAPAFPPTPGLACS
jgi:predicted ATPase